MGGDIDGGGGVGEAAGEGAEPGEEHPLLVVEQVVAPPARGTAVRASRTGWRGSAARPTRA